MVCAQLFHETFTKFTCSSSVAQPIIVTLTIRTHSRNHNNCIAVKYLSYHQPLSNVVFHILFAYLWFLSSAGSGPSQAASINSIQNFAKQHVSPISYFWNLRNARMWAEFSIFVLFEFSLQMLIVFVVRLPASCTTTSSTSRTRLQPSAGSS